MARSATAKPEVSRLAPTKADAAALAFSLLSTKCAEVVNRRLSIGERMRLREGLSRVRDASDAQRHAAVRMLAREIKRGMEWPRPSMHDEKDCPFTKLATHPRRHTLEIFERVSVREPLEVAVALCHLSSEVRDEIWNELSGKARTAVMNVLDDVHGVSTVATRGYARDVEQRLGRAIRHNDRRRMYR